MTADVTTGGTGPTDPPAPPERRSELSSALAELEHRVSAACSAAGRARSEVTVIAVTKTWPASDVTALAGLGLRDFGENRDQEAGRKAAELSELAVRWHFVGQVQSRKARSVASYIDVVHSLDRAALADALSEGALRAGRTVDVLVQVRLDDDPHRGGVDPAQAGALADRAAGLPGLRLAGVMAVAPLGADPASAYARLADVAAGLRRSHPAAVVVSAGMSGDLEAAVAAGATHVRIGTALLGRRPARLG